MPLRRILAVILPFACAPAMAQQPIPPGPPPGPSLTERAAIRFPQPVRVDDLLRRQVLRPVEQQNVLGRVAGVVRRPDGAVLVVVSLGGVLGLGTRPVAVPVEAAALLGEHLAILDLTPEQLKELPTFDGAGTQPVLPDEKVRVGLTRPSH
jgi:hypothetical protein